MSTRLAKQDFHCNMVPGTETCKSIAKPDTKRNKLKLVTSIVTDLLALNKCMFLQPGKTTQFSPTLPTASQNLNNKVGCTKRFCRAGHVLLRHQVIR